MTSSRDAFLQRVRQAVAQGNRAGAAADLPEREQLGYQGAGLDPVAHFCEALKAAGGQPHVVADRDAAVATVLELVQALGRPRLLLGRGAFLDTLQLAGRLRKLGLNVVATDGHDAGSWRAPYFAADVGISGVAYLVAETGSLVVAAAASDPRSVSLLPPVHIAVAERAQLLPDLFDLFAVCKPAAAEDDEPDRLPSCLTVVTGPSKTGDIELRLVTGVHGPGVVHVILVDS
jgi:L-lactate dehydrogenase complex protein LldG